ncbi:MAG: phosphotransferase [Victivallales bacterium]|nr:phosphotransferase [Victivallales bacterium]
MTKFRAQSTSDMVWPPVDQLLADSRLLRQATSAGTADILLYERDGIKYLVKTFDRHGWLARKLFGATIGREWHNLKNLREAGFTAAPRPLAWLSPDTLVMEFVEGAQLLSPRHYTSETKPPMAFFEQLRACVRQFHRLGYAHGDLRRANLIIRSAGEPCVIDWATATASPPAWRPLLCMLHRQQRKSDQYSLFKLLDDYYPELSSDAERSHAQPGPLLRFARFLRYHLYRHGLKEWLGRTHHGEKHKSKP